MDNHFGGVIWTNHALDRLRERGIKQGDAWATFNRPQQSRKGNSGNWVYYKNWNGTQIEVVAKKNEKGEWLILSVWSRRVSEPTVYESGDSFLQRLYNWLFKV